ncbi:MULTISPECIES: hypothetical protein [Pseudomonas]|jgi:hypothetical protein|uniref:hypothetical protein n=1 Tax=Pseudomonas TaxID=286 RepID=UPI000486CE8C|nr:MULTISPECIES: hypothetical protein [Pseudomonas]PRA59953.1 sn-glycerol-3-phosphate transporter [Pseudomonas sp. MYb115]QXN50146.1 sn-glycerol-3-phosphate transporter [Pseudomonas fluorescens]WSO24465.1 sn-glycerol-3-phosphate transporter [Pseudomonas fluorescens]
MKKSWICLLLAFTYTTHAWAQDDEQGTWYLQTSVYTRHFSPDPEHNNHQQLLGLEYHDASGWLLGGATFLNSFDQRAYYAYGGKRYDSADYPLYVKLTGGLLEGYHGKYQNKIPLNRYGVAPVVIPSLGTYYGPVSAELVLLGFNAAMITTGVRF